MCMHVCVCSYHFGYYLGNMDLEVYTAKDLGIMMDASLLWKEKNEPEC